MSPSQSSCMHIHTHTWFCQQVFQNVEAVLQFFGVLKKPSSCRRCCFCLQPLFRTCLFPLTAQSLFILVFVLPHVWRPTLSFSLFLQRSEWERGLLGKVGKSLVLGGTTGKFSSSLLNSFFPWGHEVAGGDSEESQRTTC